ncbi:MAG: hypothetical protein D6820_05975, partial [Lentisphaerae bacterium]
QYVYAAVGYRGRPPASREANHIRVFEPTTGERIIFVSHNAGITWQRVPFSSTDGWRGCYSVHVLPGGIVCLGAGDGIYISEDHGVSWRKLRLPGGMQSCWGAVPSPDGEWIYAVFGPLAPGVQKDATSELYAAWIGDSVADPFSSLRWRRIGVPNQFEGLYTWPVIDPRSGERHRLLMASRSQRQGLWLLETSPTPDGKLRNISWRHIFYWEQGFWGPKDSVAPEFETSWEQYQPRPLTFAFTPATWQRPGIWTTSGQILYRTWTDEDDWDKKWYCLSSRKVKTWPYRSGVKNVTTWRTRGMQCTYTYAAESYRNYMIQSQADNGVIESWDGGNSWTMQTRPNTWRGTNSMCNLIITNLYPAVVLAHTSFGFGANANEGILWGKKLEYFDPRDRWLRLAGGPEAKLGLPSMKFRWLEVKNEQGRRRLFVATQKGVWMHPDLREVLEGKGQFTNITTGSPLAEHYIRRVFIRNPHRIVISADWLPVQWRGLWEGNEQADGSWTWTHLRQGTGAGIAAVINGRWTLVNVRKQEAPTFWEIEYSLNNGRTWQVLCNFELAAKVRRRPYFRPD